MMRWVVPGIMLALGYVGVSLIAVLAYGLNAGQLVLVLLGGTLLGLLSVLARQAS
jgi:uncharacterized membrane protein